MNDWDNLFGRVMSSSAFQPSRAPGRAPPMRSSSVLTSAGGQQVRCDRYDRPLCCKHVVLSPFAWVIWRTCGTPTEALKVRTPGPALELLAEHLQPLDAMASLPPFRHGPISFFNQTLHLRNNPFSFTSFSHRGPPPASSFRCSSATCPPSSLSKASCTQWSPAVEGPFPPFATRPVRRLLGGPRGGSAL